MRLNRFGIPLGMVLPAAIYGLAAGVVLVLAEAPEWVYPVATLPYWPFFLYQLNGRLREEAPQGVSARGRRPGRRLG